MAKLIAPDRPGGFLDFLPQDYLVREKIIRTIENTFRLYGFDSIETPIVEFSKTLAGETSDTGKNIFHLESSSGETLSLRFDHTVPLARVLAANPYHPATKSGLRLPWRRMAVGPVFRAETPQSGRYRQFWQFDADIAGSNSMLADTEIVTVVARTIQALGIKRFIIRLNNRKVLNGLADLAGIVDRPEASREAIAQEMMRILDKIDKIGLDGVCAELAKSASTDSLASPALEPDKLAKIKEFIAIDGGNKGRLAKAAKLFAGIAIAQEGLAELGEILANLPKEVADDYVVIDFSIARGLDYYTGPIMETNLLDAKQFGSIFSGGRYNGLVSRFTGKDLPAVGASIGIDRLFAALDYLGLIDRAASHTSEIVVLRLASEHDADYLAICEDLRTAGWRAEVCLEADNTMKAQLAYALHRGTAYAIFCGENEFTQGTIQVKNLTTREQIEIKRSELAQYFTNLRHK